jgi:hypothetical protein
VRRRTHAHAHDSRQSPWLARISHTLAGAGLVLAALTGFRTLRKHPVLAAARKPAGTTVPRAIVPQQYDKCGLVFSLWKPLLKRLLLGVALLGKHDLHATDHERVCRPDGYVAAADFVLATIRRPMGDASQFWSRRSNDRHRGRA